MHLVKIIDLQRRDGGTAGTLKQQAAWRLVSTNGRIDLTQPSLPPVIILSEPSDGMLEVNVFDRTQSAQPSDTRVYTGPATRSLSHNMKSWEFRVETSEWIITLYCY